MSVDKIKHKIKNRRKLTYKELEWDYLPMIVLFAVVTGILTLLFILLIVYQDSLAEEELSRLRKFRLFNNYLNNEEYIRPTEVIEMEDIFIEDN